MEGARAGVMVAIKKDIAGPGVVDRMEIPSHLWGSVCGVKISTNNKQGKLWIWGVYITPGEEELRKQIYDYISSNSNSNKKKDRIMVIGDFNARLCKEDYNKEEGKGSIADDRHIEFCVNNDLKYIKEEGSRSHTYIKDGGTAESIYTSRIDDILHREDSKSRATIRVIERVAGSDHLPVISTWNRKDLGILIQSDKNKELNGGKRNKLKGIGEDEKKKIQKDMEQNMQLHNNKWAEEVREWGKGMPTREEIDNHVEHITKIMQDYQRRANNLKEGRSPHVNANKKGKSKPCRVISRPLRNIFGKIKDINACLGKIRKGEGDQKQEIEKIIGGQVDNTEQVEEKGNDDGDNSYTEGVKHISKLRAQVRYIYQKDQNAKDKAHKDKEIATFDKARKTIYTRMKMAENEDLGEEEMASIINPETGNEHTDSKGIVTAIQTYFDKLMEKPKDTVGKGGNDTPWDKKEAIDRISNEDMFNTKDNRVNMDDYVNDNFSFQNTLSHLSKGKAPGPDGITKEILQWAPSNIKEALHTIIKQMWKIQYTPQCWKTSNTTLLYKKGDRRRVDNYRPIAMANTMAKVWTACICNAMTEYAESNNLFQSG